MYRDEGMSKPVVDGVYAHQRLSLEAAGKAHPRKARASNRTREIRPSGIIGGLGKRRHGGTVNPPCNRKSRNGNPPPTAGRALLLSQRTDDELVKPLIVIQRVEIPPDQSRADRSVASLAIHRATGG